MSQPRFIIEVSNASIRFVQSIMQCFTQANINTAKRNRINLPISFTKPPLEKGNFTFRRNENMLAIRYHDKKEIYILSTMHDASLTSIGKNNRNGDEIIRLKAIHDYNQSMGVVDRNDGQIGHYKCIQKTYKWSTKLFFHFVEEAIFNSFIIYNKAGGSKRFLDFKLEAINSILLSAGKDVSKEVRTSQCPHYPEIIPPSEHKEKPQ